MSGVDKKQIALYKSCCKSAGIKSLSAKERPRFAEHLRDALESILTKAKKQHFSEQVCVPAGPGVLDDVMISLRWSRALRCGKIINGRATELYDTIDVVNIGWAPLVLAVEFSDLRLMPRGLGALIWTNLKDMARREGRALYVECILDQSGKLIKHLESLGFYCSPMYESSMLFVPDGVEPKLPC